MALSNTKIIFKISVFLWHIKKHTLTFFYLEPFRKYLYFRKPLFKKVSFMGSKFSILLNPKNGFVDDVIFLKGIYEPYILSLMKKEIKKGDTFLDVGGNIGLHSLYASRLVGCKGKVITFEPIDFLYAQMNKSIKKNNMDNIIVHKLGCGSKKEVLEICLHNKDIGKSTIISKSIPYKIKKKINIIKLDSFLKHKIDFVKIDVEGYEYEVVMGMKKLIKKYSPKVCLEFSPFFYNKIDKNISKDLLLFFQDQDYLIYNINKDYEEIININDFLNNFHKKQTNLFFTKVSIVD